tara:strand:+ start:96 stop:446 length:351 start_codon:yes stop_codon:yes gene_type:complete
MFLKCAILELLKIYNMIFNMFYQYPIDENENENEIKKFKRIQNLGLDLFIKKNKDYGKAYSKYGTIGVLIRINDKISRLQTITKNKILLVDDESLKDTLIDLHNYSAIALMELNKE